MACALRPSHRVAARAEQQERAADDENRRAHVEQQREDERAEERQATRAQNIPAECPAGTSAKELGCVERSRRATVRCAAVGRNLKYSEISVRVTEACSHQRVGGKLFGTTGCGIELRRRQGQRQLGEAAGHVIAGGDDDEAVVAARGGPGARFVGIAGGIEGRVARRRRSNRTCPREARRSPAAPSCRCGGRRRRSACAGRGLRRAGGRPRRCGAPPPSARRYRRHADCSRRAGG